MHSTKFLLQIFVLELARTFMKVVPETVAARHNHVLMPVGQNPPIEVSVDVCNKEMIMRAQHRKKVSPVHWRFLQL